MENPHHSILQIIFQIEEDLSIGANINNTFSSSDDDDAEKLENSFVGNDVVDAVVYDSGVDPEVVASCDICSEAIFSISVG